MSNLLDRKCFAYINFSLKNSFNFGQAAESKDRQTNRQTGRQTCRQTDQNFRVSVAQERLPSLKNLEAPHAAPLNVERNSAIGSRWHRMKIDSGKNFPLLAP